MTELVDGPGLQEDESQGSNGVDVTVVVVAMGLETQVGFQVSRELWMRENHEKKWMNHMFITVQDNVNTTANSRKIRPSRIISQLKK